MIVKGRHEPWGGSTIGQPPQTVLAGDHGAPTAGICASQLVSEYQLVTQAVFPFGAVAITVPLNPAAIVLRTWPAAALIAVTVPS